MLGPRSSGTGGAAAIGAAGLALVLFALLVAPPAGARAAAGSASAAFGVRASNGFWLDVVSEAGAVTIAASERRPPIATFSRRGAPRPANPGNGASSIYRARSASSDPNRIEVRLGQLGRISVAFRPSGRSRVTRLGRRAGRLGCQRPRRIVRRLGTFLGTVEFRGEGGYTAVRASRARGSVGTPLPAACAGAAAARPRRAGGALLRAVNRRAGTRFVARTTGAGAAFLATWRERLGAGVLVSRRAYAGAPRGSFRFGRRLRSARVAPPAPFSGSARYRDRRAGEPRWRGNLRVTFPGIAVPLTGSRFRARLGAGR